MLRAGLSGCGAVGLRAVAQIRTHQQCDVVALHDPAPAALQRAGERTGIGIRTADFAQLLQSGIDFVILAGPCGVRLEQVRRAADQGVHCLLHAPMAPDAATADAMVALCDKAQVKLGVAVTGHEDPVLEQVRRMVAADWLGGPVCVQGIWADDDLLTSPPQPGDWRTQPELAGGHPMLRTAAHHVHLATWLTGRTAVRVTAQSASGFLPLSADGTVATALLRGNVLCTFVASHLTRARVFAIHGTDGGVRLAGDRIWLCGHTEYRGEVFDYLRAGEEQVLTRLELRSALEAAAPTSELHGRFVQWIDDCDDFPCPGEQAALDLRVLDAIARAAASGRTETV
jgi:predicted dehydrogenase